MTEKTEALRLADELERDKWHVPAVVMQAAADELRRLHASCEDYAQHKQRQDQRVLELAERVPELRAQRDALLEALKDIAGTDPVDAALDPQRAVRIARAAIKAVEGEGT